MENLELVNESQGDGSKELRDKLYKELKKKPSQIIKDYYQFISLLKMFLLKMDNDIPTREIMVKVGLTPTQFYYRLNNPEAWKKEELLILIETMNWEVADKRRRQEL